MIFRRISSLRNLRNLTSSMLDGKCIHSSPRFVQQLQYRTPLSARETDGIAENLRNILGNENVILSESAKLQHGQDEGPDKGLPPDIVAYAESTDHVSEVKNCYQNNILNTHPNLIL